MNILVDSPEVALAAYKFSTYINMYQKMRNHTNTHTHTYLTHTHTHTHLKVEFCEKRKGFKEGLQEVVEEAWRTEARSWFQAAKAWWKKERWPLDFVWMDGILNTHKIKDKRLYPAPTKKKEKKREQLWIILHLEPRWRTAIF